MKRTFWMLLAMAAGSPGLNAAACNPRDIAGAYGFQLSGLTAISDAPKHAVSVGRLVFDGSGNISGFASVNFAGYLLGNPVRGTYQAADDCTLTWKLQDDSGNFQNFRGAASDGAKKIQVWQTDAGAGQSGVLTKMTSDCSSAGIQGRYKFIISGSRVSLDTGQVTDTISRSGLVEADASGKLTIIPEPGLPQPLTGSYEMDDCFAQMQFEPAMNFRAVVVDGGNEVVGVETDPATAVTVKLTALNPKP